MSTTHRNRPNGSDEGQQTETDVSSEEILALLDADYTQSILGAIQRTPKSARELAAECGASRPTVYRRLNSLQDAGLIETEMLIDADGHHRTVFEATVEQVSVELTDAGLSVRVSYQSAESAPARPAALATE